LYTSRLYQVLPTGIGINFVRKVGGVMASAEREPITEVCGKVTSGIQRVRGQALLEAESIFVFHKC